MSKPLALIIEDNPDSGVIFSQAMKAAGFRTEIIDSGAKAVTWLAVKVPDVIVLDMRLPHVSGTEILHQIRADPRLAQTPVIAATAHPELVNSLSEQVDVALIKPISFVQLRDLAMRLYPQDE